MKRFNWIKDKQLKNYKITTDTGSWDLIMNLTGGFNEGELVVIAARPGCGKTTLALNLAVWGSQDQTTLFDSLEMTAPELYARTKRFIAPETVKYIDDLYIMTDESLNCDKLVKQIKTVKPKFVFIDYLQIMDEDMRKATKKLKKIAKKYKLVIFLCAQLNRKAESSTPKLSMLRDSGTIEQDADQVWFITEDTLIVAKNRKGQIGSIPICFNKKCSFIFEDKVKLERRKKCIELYNKACATKTTFGFLRITNQIKKLDFDFWCKYVKCKMDIDWVVVL